MARHEQLSITQLDTPTGSVIRFGAAEPTTGTGKVGDTVINTAPSAGGVFAWVCTTAGTPGTWKAVAIAA
jgi:hypothetical protein